MLEFPGINDSGGRSDMAVDEGVHFSANEKTLYPLGI